MAQEVRRGPTKAARAEPPKQQLMAISKKKKQPALQSGEKRLRALNKLLRQIEELQERESRGEALDEQQQEKVGRLDVVLEEMESLMAGG